MGKSSCASLASRAAKRSKTSFTTAVGRASDRSTLLITTMGLRPTLRALETTNFVCGSGPSAASTRTSAPSTILRMRSTSPPKSAWPGVSTMLMRVPCQSIEVTLARMVMPRSRSRSLESIARSATRWFSRKAPDCCSSRSTRVVLPWSTWAMIATLRNDMRGIRIDPPYGGQLAAEYKQRRRHSNGFIQETAQLMRISPRNEGKRATERGAGVAGWTSRFPAPDGKANQQAAADRKRQTDRPQRDQAAVVEGVSKIATEQGEDDEQGAKSGKQQEGTGHDQQHRDTRMPARRRRARPLIFWRAHGRPDPVGFAPGAAQDFCRKEDDERD